MGVVCVVLFSLRRTINRPQTEFERYLVRCFGVAINADRKRHVDVSLVAVLALNGCSSRQIDRPQQSNRLGALAVLYGRYVGTHGGRAPANQGELMGFIKKSGEPTLKQFGISHAEELFEPADDGQSIVVSYGRTNVTDPNPVIAYESQAVGDKRRVLHRLGRSRN